MTHIFPYGPGETCLFSLLCLNAYLARAKASLSCLFPRFVSCPDAEMEESVSEAQG